MLYLQASFVSLFATFNTPSYLKLALNSKFFYTEAKDTASDVRQVPCHKMGLWQVSMSILTLLHSSAADLQMAEAQVWAQSGYFTPLYTSQCLA